MSRIALGMDAPVASAARSGRLWLATSRMLLLGLSLLFLLCAITGIRVGMTVQAGVYLFGMVALNLPHGGFEHYLNLQARRTQFTFGYLAAFLLLIGLFALFFLSFPVGGLALALAVAMAKGGGADLKVMEACTGDAHLPGRGSRLLAGVARGVPIMLLPILFFPGDFRFYSGIFHQIASLGAQGERTSERASNFALGVIASIEPRDEVEAMLALQMATVHQATMTMARRLTHVETLPQQDSAERALNKLARTYATQVQTLKKYRSNGEQVVRVERVTVEDGGKAIVGNVNHGRGRDD